MTNWRAATGGGGPGSKRGGGNCVCQEGFIGKWCEHVHCAAVARTSSTHGSPTDACGAHGICDFRSGRCVCDTGFAGPRCAARKCPSGLGQEASGDAALLPCSGRGSCADGRCACRDGWQGLACDKAVCERDSGGAECGGRGKCDDLTGKCVCDDGWGGRACEVKLCPLSYDGKECGGNGSCNHGLCACNDGWHGMACSSRLCARNSWASGPQVECSGHGKCHILSGRCSCEYGFFGYVCQHAKCGAPEPGLAPCSGHGVCDRVTGMCNCDERWFGIECERKGCFLGSEGKECSGRGTCDHDQTCRCAPGFAGRACERMLDLDKNGCPISRAGEARLRGVCGVSLGHVRFVFHHGRIRSVSARVRYQICCLFTQINPGVLQGWFAADMELATRSAWDVIAPSRPSATPAS